MSRFQVCHVVSVVFWHILQTPFVFSTTKAHIPGTHQADAAVSMVAFAAGLCGLCLMILPKAVPHVRRDLPKLPPCGYLQNMVFCLQNIIFCLHNITLIVHHTEVWLAD